MSFNEHIKPKPDSTVEKKQQVEDMFDSISSKYDFLNRVLSLRIDTKWRKTMFKSLKFVKDMHVLDMATGTADVAIEIAEKQQVKVIGADISEGMLSFGRLKVTKKKLENKVQLVRGDAENMPFENNTFDIGTVAFGVRNFQDLPKGLAEFYRVLKPNGQLRILEFSTPKNKFVAWFFGLYFNKILPWIGKKVSGSATAYIYLPVSVNAFPSGDNFCNYLKNAGFSKINYKPLTFGIATLYSCEKQ